MWKFSVILLAILLVGCGGEPQYAEHENRGNVDLPDGIMECKATQIAGGQDVSDLPTYTFDSTDPFVWAYAHVFRQFMEIKFKDLETGEAILIDTSKQPYSCNLIRDYEQEWKDAQEKK